MKNILHYRGLAVVVLILLVVVAIVGVTRGLLSSRGNNPTKPSRYQVPASIECRISYKSSETANWEEQRLVLKAQQGGTPPQGKEQAVFKDLSVHCSYTTSPQWGNTLLIEVLDTHTGKQISATQYDFNQTTLQNQFNERGFSGSWYVRHPSKPSFLQVVCAVP